MTVMIELRDVAKSFTLHQQGGVHIPVLNDLDLSVHAGECVVLTGASGVGKSSLMRMIYGNYTTPHGTILVRHDDRRVDMASAHPHAVMEVRRRTMGYVSQFLRVVPRVGCLDIVAEPLRRVGVDATAAREKAAELLARLHLPERLWPLSPLTFSGGEQQRVNIAHGFIHPYPILLLDEPTASLDAANKAVVLALIQEACDRGAAVVGIFHDPEARRAVATRHFDTADFARSAA